MRTFLAVTLSCAVLTAGCSKPRLESKVDVPTTLGGVRALADPPRVTVTVERVQRYWKKGAKAGGFRCGHPVCLIAVPFLLWELAFPTEVDVVNVTEGGVITYSGMFKPEGEFIQARVRRGKLARDLRVLELKQLRKRLVVEVAHATVGDDGKLGEFTPTPFATQVKLLDEYRAAMKRHSIFGTKQAVLKEAIAWLDSDALPLREERLKDPEELDEVKVVALTPCHAPLLKVARTAELGPRALDAAIRCYVGDDPSRLVNDDGVLVFFDRLLDRFCALKDLKSEEARIHVGSLSRALGLHSPRRSELRRRANRCSTPNRRFLIRVFSGEPITEAEYGSALAEKDGTASWLVGRFDLRDTVLRSVVFKALRSGQVRLAHDYEKVSPDELVLRVDRIWNAALSREEVVTIAELYLRPAAAGEEVWLRRDACLKVLGGQPILNAKHLAVARAVIENALARSREQDRPALELALFVLGDRGRARQLVKAIPLEPPTRPAGGKLSDAQVEQAQLGERITTWLERILRCSRNEIRAEVRRAAAPVRPDDGKFCGVPLESASSRPAR